MHACRETVPGAKVEAVSVDLADLASIRAFANKALDGGRPLDVLVNNAGASLVSLSWALCCDCIPERSCIHAC